MTPHSRPCVSRSHTELSQPWQEGDGRAALHGARGHGTRAAQSPSIWVTWAPAARALPFWGWELERQVLIFTSLVEVSSWRTHGAPETSRYINLASDRACDNGLAVLQSSSNSSTGQ